MPRLLLFFAVCLVLLVPSSGAIAGEPALLAQGNTATGKVFSDLERRVIREVLGVADVKDTEVDTVKSGKKAKGSKGAPPGLAKRDRLPPGLERQLQRNGRLPPGLEKRTFPAHLRAQLPSPLQGTERVIVGNDVVLIERATNVILDIMQDVIVNR